MSMTDEKHSDKLSREEIAKREIGRTEISPGLSWLMTVLFILTLIVPPTVQLVHEVGLSKSPSTPSSLELFHKLPEVANVLRRAEGGLWDRVMVANRRLVRSIEEYEKQLEERSLLTRHLLGPTQHWLTALAGLGNEKAYVGRNGWLFYRPDVDYLTGPGFLEPAVLHRRALGGKQHLAQPQPDPRPAIIEFHEQLVRRGIQLILMPMPSKSAIHPEQLSSRFDGHQDSLENASFQQFIQEIRDSGVLVFDASTVMAQRKGGENEVGKFLRTDTHWTPDAMQAVAEQLKEFIDIHCPLPMKTPVQFSERIREVENLGDIATMLHLPAEQTLFPPEMAIIREVVEPDGHEWQPDAGADVLLLGDSYTNIYSLPEMKWGTGAGFAERLSFTMQRRTDRLAQNDGGSHAVRQALYQQMARGQDRLRGKRIVIWEFAARELAYGDWKSFPMPAEKPAVSNDGPRQSTPENATGQFLVRGTVRAAAGSPQPGSVPYRDAVTGVHMDDVEGVAGTFTNREIIVYLFGLHDNRLTAAAKFAPDQKVTLRLTPWETVRKKYERFNRIELDDPEFKLAELPTYWAEEVP
jgi:hypothetical protein